MKTYLFIFTANDAHGIEIVIMWDERSIGYENGAIYETNYTFFTVLSFGRSKWLGE